MGAPLFPSPLPPEAVPVLRAAWRQGLDTETIAQALSVLFSRVISEAVIYNALPIIRARRR